MKQPRPHAQETTMKSVRHPSSPADTPADVVRRRFLSGLGALPVAAAVGAGLVSPKAHAKARLKTQARIVIAGGGAAGLTAASHLARTLDGATITVVEGRKEHWYQPAATRVNPGW
ncbi:tryptophan 7-halogenase, partial [Arthrospira platensis SPKY1]|nr:tryptophan 7-halogenase [Arthrospira platensis SPKY1]